MSGGMYEIQYYVNEIQYSAEDLINLIQIKQYYILFYMITSYRGDL